MELSLENVEPRIIAFYFFFLPKTTFLKVKGNLLKAKMRK